MQLRENEQRKLTKLRENYPERTVDRAFAAELLAVNDATGFLLEDYPNDERASEILALASAVVDSERYLATVPPVESKADYDRAHEAWQRNRDVTASILELLRQGAIRAFAAGPQSRVPIPAEAWGAREPSLDIPRNRATIGRVEFVGVCFGKAEVDRVLKKTSPSDTTTTSVYNFLVDLMKSGSARKPKLEVFEALKDTYPDLSFRAFDSEWRNASKHCGAEWSRPGRPRRGK